MSGECFGMLGVVERGLYKVVYSRGGGDLPAGLAQRVYMLQGS